MSSRKISLAVVQLAVSTVKNDNLSRAATHVKAAASKGAKLVALPECFNSPYGTNFFDEYAETIPGKSTDSLSVMAKENGIYLIGGSIPERDGNYLYNTCTVWNPNGEMIAKHRKVHLFDIDIPGKIKFQESTVLTAGNALTTFEMGPLKVGIGICYDMRFAELAQLYGQLGCHLLVYPGAFNMTTGPAHWQLLQRGRAVDNELYVATVSPAHDKNASYVAYGHSSIVDPFGKVIATTEEEEDVAYADVDLDYMEEVRKMIPITYQKRTDMYEVKSKI